MSLESLAESIIEAVGGIVTDKNIEGVIKVMNGVEQGVNLRWEKHLVQKTNGMLSFNRVVCPVCTHPVEVVIGETGVRVTEIGTC